MEHYLDVSLVLRSISEDDWIGFYGPETMPSEHAQDERTMRRLVLLETTYGLDQIRDLDKINEERGWKFVRLV